MIPALPATLAELAQSLGAIPLEVLGAAVVVVGVALMWSGKP